LKTISNYVILKIFLKAALKLFSGVPLLSIDNSSVSHALHSQLSEQFSESQMAFGTTFIVTSGYLKTGTSFLKRVTGRFFRN
jgi:hypothetical protein